MVRGAHTNASLVLSSENLGTASPGQTSVPGQ